MTRKDYYTISRVLNRLKKHILAKEDTSTRSIGAELFDFLFLNLIESIKEDNPEFIEDKFRELVGETKTSQ